MLGTGEGLGHQVKHVDATIKWENKSTGKVISFTTHVLVGMKNVLIKMDTTQNGHNEALPMAVKDSFIIDSAGEYNPENYHVMVFFINPLTTNVLHHIETSQLICSANQLADFCMIGNIAR